MDKTSFIDGFARSVEDARREWLTLAAAGRDPAALEAVLAARPCEGVGVKPLYTRADGEGLAAGAPGTPPFIRGAAPDRGASGLHAAPWRVIQLAPGGDPVAANRQIREDLANGAQGLWLEPLGAPWSQAGDPNPDASGLRPPDRAITLDHFASLFEGVDLTAPHFYAWGGRTAVAGAAMLAALGARRGVAPAALRGCAGFDPLGALAIAGEAPLQPGEALASAVDAALYLLNHGYGLRPFLASGRAWRMAGGSIVQELAFALAAAVSYWRALEEAGLEATAASGAAALCLTADADLFLTIAKFRAARALWSRALEAAALPPAPPALIAEMSCSMMSASDPHVNLLRATAAAFGAGLGGAEAVLLLPFDAHRGAHDGFALRMARNTQLILQEESHLGEVADPAGGSWCVESLTAELARKAWGKFRQVEAQGGLFAAIENGHVAQRLRPVRKARETAVARGRDKLTGVNAFPNLDEHPLPERTPQRPSSPAAPATVPPAGKGERFAALVAAAQSGATLQSLAAALDVPSRKLADPIGPCARLAEPFESLRRASDQALLRHGTRPVVFLANLGKLAEFVAYATWARNFFAAGGVQAQGERGFDDLEALAAAFRASGATAACICASEKTLAALPGAALALKTAGARQVFLAGRPGARVKLSPEDGNAIDWLVHEGCDMLAVLQPLVAEPTDTSAA